MQFKAIEKALQQSVTFNTGESDESQHARDIIKSHVRKPLRIFDVPPDVPPDVPLVMPAPVVRKPLRIFDVPPPVIPAPVPVIPAPVPVIPAPDPVIPVPDPPPVMPAPPPSSRPLFDLLDSRYPDRMFSSTTHFPGAPINPNILKNSQEIDEFNKSKMAGVEGGRKKKSRQKKQHRRHRRRRSTRKHKN